MENLKDKLMNVVIVSLFCMTCYLMSEQTDIAKADSSTNIGGACIPLEMHNGGDGNAIQTIEQQTLKQNYDISQTLLDLKTAIKSNSQALMDVKAAIKNNQLSENDNSGKYVTSAVYTKNSDKSEKTTNSQSIKQDNVIYKLPVVAKVDSETNKLANSGKVNRGFGQDSYATISNKGIQTINQDSSVYNVPVLANPNPKINQPNVQQKVEKDVKPNVFAANTNRDVYATAKNRYPQENNQQNPQQKGGQSLSSGKTITQALVDAKTAIKNEQLYEAERIVDEILVVDPFNRKALKFKNRFNMLRHLDHVSALDSINKKETQKTHEVLKEEMIPYTQKMQFPAGEHMEQVQKRTIPDKTQRFNQMKRNTAKMKLNTQPDVRVPKNIEDALNIIISFEFFDVPLRDAIAFLREKTNINLVPGRDLPGSNVTLKLSDVSVKTALKYILPKGTSYEIKDNIVYVTKDKLTLHVYDVRDLLINLDDRTSDDDDGGGRSGRSSGSGSSSSFAGRSSFGGTSSFGGESRGAYDRVQELIRLITTTIEPASWDKDHGRITTREDRPGDLIVVNTAKVHKQIGDILTSMRSKQHLQVSIEARFIQMSDKFLEDIGIELQNIGINPSDTSSIGMSVDTSAGATGNAISKGLNLTYSVLKDFQIELLLNAVQESDEAEILTSPRITLSNTQRGSIRVVNEISFVSSYEIISQVPQPVIDIVEDGTVFDVRPVISTDRKHVFLEVHPNITIVTFESLPFNVAVPFAGADETTFQTLELTIEQPLVNRQELSVTVDVPDRGTLMIGGLGTTQKVKKSGGVPLLSKIPVIKRVFTRDSESIEKTNLIIILKPTIIIRDEEMGIQMARR